MNSELPDLLVCSLLDSPSLTGPGCFVLPGSFFLCLDSVYCAYAQSEHNGLCGDGMTKQPQRGPDGNFLPGNTMWAKGLEAMRKPKIFKTPDDLLKSCIEYFEWCNENPFMEAKNLSDGTIIELPKMRVTSIQGLQVFLGIRKTTWEDYCARPDYKPVTEWVEKTIWDRKFSGAASGFFNASIISREMGLEDHQKISSDMTVNVIDFFDDGDSDEK